MAKETVEEKVELTLEQLRKKLANEGHSIKRASDIVEEEKIRTGIFGLDWVLDKGISQGEGGLRLEFWGGESTGKTTFCLYIIKQYQKLGKKCVFIDGEKSFDKTWAAALGVDTEKVLVIEPDTLEDLGNMIPELIKNTDLIIIDSITSFIPDDEVERDLKEQTMALQARINATITRKIYAAYKDRKTTMIFINQMREKVGVMYGSPNTSGGGRAIKHLYNTRVEFRTGKPIDVDGERVGHEIHLKCIKNKRGVANRVAELDMYNDGRIDNKKSIFYAAIKYLVIEVSGKTYKYKDFDIVGKDNFLEQFENWSDLENDTWIAIEKTAK